MDLESPISDRVESGELVGTVAQSSGCHPRSNSSRLIEATLSNEWAETGTRRVLAEKHISSKNSRDKKLLVSGRVERENAVARQFCSIAQFIANFDGRPRTID
jgi:hypothetical protein